MSDLEHRLHHAARALREVSIEPPPFESLPGAPRPAPSSRRMPALLLPLLFVLGGLAVMSTRAPERGVEAELPVATSGSAPRGGIIPGSVPAEPGAGRAAPADGEAVVAGALSASPSATRQPTASGRSSSPGLSAHQEVALISSLSSRPGFSPSTHAAALRTSLRRFQ